MSVESLWDVHQAADFLGCGVNSLYIMCRRGEVPHVRLGKRSLRFRRSDLEAWLDAKREGPELEAASR